MSVFPIARINGSRNQVMEMEVGPFTITPTDLQVKCLFPVSSTLYSPGLETLVLEGGMYFHQEIQVISLN